MADYSVRKTQLGHYVVYRKGGGSVSRVFRAIEDAYKDLETRVKRDEQTHRNCLRCGDRFASEGWGNRLCHPCQPKGLDLGMAEEQVARL